LAFEGAGRPAPLEIRLKRAERLLEVDFEDGKSFRYTAELLRIDSPSAEVKGHGPGQRVTVPGRRHVNIIAIEPVGNYAVRLRFDDLHDTGIYSWEYLYDLGVNQQQVWRDYLQALQDKGLSRDP